MLKAELAYDCYQVHEKKGFRCMIAGGYEQLVLGKIGPLMI